MKAMPVFVGQCSILFFMGGTMKSQTLVSRTQIELCRDCYQQFETQHVLAVSRQITGVSATNTGNLSAPTPTQEATSAAPTTTTAPEMHDEIADELARIEALPDIDERMTAIDKLLLELGLSWQSKKQPADQAIHLRPVDVIPAQALARTRTSARVKRPPPYLDNAVPSQKPAPAKRGRPCLATRVSSVIMKAPPAICNSPAPRTALQILDQDYPKSGIAHDDTAQMPR